MIYWSYLQLGILVSTLINACVNQNWPSAVIVLIAALIYAQERYERGILEATPAVDLTSINSSIEMLGARLDKVQKTHDEVNKLASETKRLLTETNVGAAFRPRIMKKD